MESKILAALSPVRLRQRYQSVTSGVIYGLLCSGVVGVILGATRLITGDPVSMQTVLTALLAGPVVGAIIGLLWARPWKQAASAVDTHYELKDRTVTALEFAKTAEQTPFHQLQLDDATAHLANVDAKRAAPIRMPRQFPWVAASLALAATLLLWPLHAKPVQARTVQPAGIGLAATEMKEDLQELEEFAEEQDLEEIKTLIDELKEKIEELEKPDTDVRKALATISEMQEKLQQEQAKYNDTMIDAQLNSLGAAMAAAEAFEAAATKLEEGDFDKAAEELEKMENVDLQRKESRSASEKLAKVAKSMKEAGLGKMSDQVSELSDSISENNSKKACADCKSLSKSIKKHSMCKSLNKMMQCKLNKLSECKSMCKSGSCSKCGGNCNKDGSGQCNSQNISLAKGQTNKKSNSPGKSAGAKSAGNINGDLTKLDGTRNMQEITGQMSGEGDSEFETTTSPEGKETARRKVQETFARYQKMSDAVLDSEPIPLGHRQTIRKYFELIRPSASDETVE
jgi:hypothetical protein